METQNKNIPMLELLLRPAFCVTEGRITKLNQAAAAYVLQEGDGIVPMLATGQDEYAAFTDGCLYLTLRIGSQTINASVLALDGCHLFILNPAHEDAQLQALALAAAELREPLSAMMTNAQCFLPQVDADSVHLAQFNRRMYQMMRIVSNMSDAALFTQATGERMEYLDVCSFLEELLCKTAQQLLAADMHLEYFLPNAHFCILADAAKLERAVYNLISNAAKHSSPGSKITFRLEQRSKLYLSVTDDGPAMDNGKLGNIYSRYLRTPAVTDGQDGIGLGMVLVRATATLHGGTVLIDHPQGRGNRVTMTMALQQSPHSHIRSPILRIDYAGERDHGLQELADVLPAALYAPDKIN